MRGVAGPAPSADADASSLARVRVLRLPDAALVTAAGLVAGLALDGTAALLATAWAAAVLVVVRSDLERFVIPEAASGAIAVLGVAARLIVAWPDGGAAAIEALGTALAGGLAAFALFWIVSALFRRQTGTDGLGFGDVKLAGASALWLTPLQQAAALEIACLAALALVLARARGSGLRGHAVPFGAFLGPAAWLVFVAGPLFERWVGTAA